MRLGDLSMRDRVRREAGTGWWSLLSMRRALGRHAQAANLLVAEDGRVQLADFGACALLERVEASAVMSESRSQASLDSGASCDGGSSPLPPQVPRAGRPAGHLGRLLCRCLPGCGITHAWRCLSFDGRTGSCYRAEPTLHASYLFASYAHRPLQL